MRLFCKLTFLFKTLSTCLKVLINLLFLKWTFTIIVGIFLCLIILLSLEDDIKINSNLD